MTKELLVAGVSFGLFVVCPRMAGMTHIMTKYSSASMVVTLLFGVVVSVPILLFMIFVFSKYGLWGALVVCVLTDLGAALLMKEISIHAGMETLIVSIFVIAGVKIAPVLSAAVVK